MTTYMIETGMGDMLCQGLQEHEAMKIARQKANERGEAVYLWDSEGEGPTEVMPQPVEDTGDTDA